jgi:cytochrome c-type biogenesis protein CcmH/NrfF
MTAAAAILLAASALHVHGATQELPSPGPSHAGYTEAVTARHSHDGPLGDKLLYIEQKIRCTCGCTLDTHTCQYQMQCGESPVFTQRIMAALEAGETEDVILAGFVADYGMDILGSPPREGFNRIGYIMPWVAFALSGILIGLFLRRGVARGRKRAPVVVSDISEKDWERLREEMKAAEKENW